LEELAASILRVEEQGKDGRSGMDRGRGQTGTGALGEPIGIIITI
jgi:hypothetical protein